MECAPTANDDVEKTAAPDASGDVPITVPPSRNRTVPVAAEGVTTAVNVTLWPAVEGFALDVNPIDEAASTVSETVVDALMKFASPL